MIVKFFVIQENEKLERHNKFITEVDLTIPLMNGTTHFFDGVPYIVVEQHIIKEEHKNVVEAYCYESKIGINETNKESAESGFDEH